ncbi:hypothetical protein C7212DRAFT_342361 [Tuber magnatum]|uniref:Uncharacterized protein n=1 Tax=Tuber magnatum TaxID=42249 RepID=A0A317SU88_9PEZI|nr:hypothetical protein C7212DRAFT_342361 [Tuber magnatum]
MPQLACVPHEEYLAYPLGGPPLASTAGLIDRISKTWHFSRNTISIVLVPRSLFFYMVWLVVSGLLLLLARLVLRMSGYWGMRGSGTDMGESGDDSDIGVRKGEGSALAGWKAFGDCLPEGSGESGSENVEDGVLGNGTGGITEVILGSGLGEKVDVSVDRFVEAVGCEKVEEKEEVVLVGVCEGDGEEGEKEEGEEEMVEGVGEKEGDSKGGSDRGEIRGTRVGEEEGDEKEKERESKGEDESERGDENVKENKKKKKDESKGGAEGRNDERKGGAENREEGKSEKDEEKDGNKGKGGNGEEVGESGREDELEEQGAGKSDEVPETEGNSGGDVKENPEVAVAEGILKEEVNEGVEEREEDEGGVVLPS